MTVERIDIVIQEQGSRVVKRSLEDIGGSARRSGDMVDFLKRALGGLTVFLAVKKVLEYADAYTNLQNRLRATGLEGLALDAVQNKLLKTANDTRSSLQSTVELYSRLAVSSKELGTSQNELIGFTRSLNQAVILSGASGVEASAGIIQLSQGLASGTLRGDELRSVLEQLPAVADVIAKHMGITRGQLRKFGEEGKITAQVVIEAFKNARKELEERFAKTVPTISQSFEVLKNNAIDLVGRLDKITGVSTAISKALLYVGLNIDSLADSLGKLVIVLGTATTAYITFNTALKVGAALEAAQAAAALNRVLAAYAVSGNAAAAATAAGAAASLRGAGATSVLGLAFAKLGSLATTAGALVLRALSVLNATPLGALIAAIVVVSGLILGFGSDINVGIDRVTTLMDVVRAFGEVGADAFRAVRDTVAETFGGLASYAGTALSAIAGLIGPAVSDFLSFFHGFFDGVGDGWAGVLRGTARVVDAMAGLITGLVIGAVRLFGGLPGVIANFFKRIYNEGAQIVEDLLNVVVGAINKVRGFVGASLLETVSLTKLEVDEKLFETYGQNIAASIQDGFEIQGGFAEKFVNDTFKRAQELAGIREDERRLLGKVKGPDLDSKTSPAKVGGLDPKALKSAETALRSLLDRIAPVQGAILEMAKAEGVLSTARKLGIIDAQGEAKYLQLLQLYYRDALDPLAALNREYDKQERLLGLTADAREVEAAKLDAVQQLQRSGIILDEKGTETLRLRIAGLQDLNKVVAAQDAILAATIGRRKEFAIQLEAITKLLANPNSGVTKADVPALLPDHFQGTVETFNNQITSVKIFYDQLEQLRALDLISEQSAQLQKKQALESMVPTDLFAGTQEALDLQVLRFQTMYEQIDALRQANLISEQTAAQMQAKVAVAQTEHRLEHTRAFFGELAGLAQSGNKKLAAIGKAAAVTQATIDGILAVQKALASAPPPFNYALAAAVGITAAANVAKIAGFEQGGFTGNGGRQDIAGVVHGREFVVNADATAKNRQKLERMNRGGDTMDGPMKLVIETHGTPQTFERAPSLGPNEVRLIARDEVDQRAPAAVARDLGNPNSATSKSMTNNFEVTRKR